LSRRGNLFQIRASNGYLGSTMGRAEFPSDVARAQFEQVRPMLEAARRRTRPRKHDLYDVFCAVLYFIDSGAAWRSLPSDFPPWRTVHEYFTQWTTARGGHATLLEQALRQLGREEQIERLKGLIGPRM
jgi:transposase